MNDHGQPLTRQETETYLTIVIHEDPAHTLQAVLDYLDAFPDAPTAQAFTRLLERLHRELP